MSSVAEPFQRDELHLFLAVLLHLAAGLLIYAMIVTNERQPHAVMLEGLPIVFGKMISPGEQGGDAPKTLAKSEPAQAQQAAATAAAQQQPSAAPGVQPVQRRPAETVQARTPETAPVRPAEPTVTQTPARPPAAVALDSPSGTPPAAANVPALRLKPDPKAAEREPPPPEAATAQQRSAPPVAAERAAEEARAKAANVPGVKPAIVPQIDSRQRVVVPPRPVEREPPPAPEEPLKTAEAKPAAEAPRAEAAARPVTPQPLPERARPADTAETRQPPAAQQRTETQPAAQAARPAEPPATVRPPAVQAVPQQPETPATAAPPPEQRARQPETVVQAQAEDLGQSETGQPATGGAPVPRQRPAEPERTATAEAGQQPAGEQPAGEQPAGSQQAAGQSGATPSGGQRGRLDALRRASAGLSGLGTGTKGVPGGTAATGGASAAMQAEGSRLAQACMEERRVFKAGDRIDAAFTVDIDRARGRLQLGQESAGSLSRPRVVEIEAALNGCAPFMDFVMAQQGLTTFRFLFSSGRR